MVVRTKSHNRLTQDFLSLVIQGGGGSQVRADNQRYQIVCTFDCSGRVAARESNPVRVPMPLGFRGSRTRLHRHARVHQTRPESRIYKPSPSGG